MIEKIATDDYREIIRVIVKKNDNFYQCKLLPTSWRVKCGYCDHGLINPFAVKSYDDKCLVCGAELSTTTYKPKTQSDFMRDRREYSP
jgi:hypothetical protein